MRFRNYLKEMPETWDKESIEKFGKSIGKAPDEHGFFNVCVLRMKGSIDDPQGFCANLIDIYKNKTTWRGEKK